MSPVTSTIRFPRPPAHIARRIVQWVVVVLAVLAAPGAAAGQVVQKPEATFDAGYVPNCAAIARSWPSSITEDLIVDGLVCSEGKQLYPADVARTYIRACNADLNWWINAYVTGWGNTVLGNIVDYDADDSIRSTFQKLQTMTRDEVQQYAQQRLRFKGATQQCFASYRIQQLESRSTPRTAPSPSAGTPPSPPATPAPVSPKPEAPPAPPTPPDTPERKAVLSAIDEVLADTKKPPAPVPPRIQVVSNSGTRCMDVAIVNPRLDEKKEYWSYTYRVRNLCPTPQLFVAEINEYGGGPLAPAFDFIFGHSGSWWTWSHREQPTGLGFTPSDPRGDGSPPLAALAVIDAPFRGRSARITEPIYLWLATCEGYADANESVANALFRAASRLAYDNRVRCVPNKTLR